MIQLCVYCNETILDDDEQICTECGFCQVCERFDSERHTTWCDHS